jgi:hypothetical protein
LTGLTGHHHRSDRWSTVSSSELGEKFNLVVTPIPPPSRRHQGPFRDHHAEGLLDAQVKGAVQALGDMPTEGVKATHHQAPGLHVTLLDILARFKGGGPQLLQLLLRGVVGRLEGLCLGRQVPQSVPQA